jgi:hypothetical protein
MFQEGTLNPKILFFTFFLLVAYSISSFFVPEYIGSEVLQLNEVEKNSDKYASDLKEAIEQSDVAMTKEMAQRLITGANILEKQRLNDTRRVIDLIQSHSLILLGILLIHLGALMSVLRSRNET